jgi:hypothetical protein
MEVDANLGVEGLPQSGTGQATLFTGTNAARILGRHFGPYPHSTLKPMLRDQNIFARVNREGKSAAFANAFPQRFFEYIATREGHTTATTFSCLSSGLRLRDARDLAEGNAISADITGEGWHKLGHPEIPVVSPEVSGERLAWLAASMDFTLFEYWRTDHAGHSMNMSEAIEVLEVFDRFLAGIIGSIDPERTLVLLTSDHGNIEDMSTKVHTRNPVPVILHGKHHEEVAREIRKRSAPDLAAVTPAVMEFLKNGL